MQCYRCLNYAALTLQVAAVVSSTFYSIWNLFSGFLIPQPSMPRWWFWCVGADYRLNVHDSFATRTWS